MHELPATSHGLLQRLQERSDDGWSEFLSIYGQALRRYCRSRGLQDADADDVFAEVLVALEHAVSESKIDRAKGSFRAWLFRVTRNLTVNQFRKRAHEAIGSGDTRVAQALASHPSAADSESTALWLEYRSHLFHWAAEQIRPMVDERTWMAFWQTAVEGVPPKEVAAALNTTVGNVYTAKCRVIARLRDVVEGLDDPSVR